MNTFIIESLNLALTKKKTTYANLKLRNGDRVYEGKIWDWTDGYAAVVKVGAVIEATYTENTYQGALQLILHDVRKYEGDIGAFMKKSMFNIDEMFSNILGKISSFVEPLPKHILINAFYDEKIFKAFQTGPAAVGVHGNWVGGLLEHTWSMCQLAEPIIAHYKKYAPNLSRDKILFGIIMHDMGKIHEYALQGATFVKTTVGCLSNHIVIAPVLINKYAENFSGTIDEIEMAHLYHLVASHHGKLEWGSPVVPSTLEAVILHQIDLIDSQFMHAWDMIKQGASSENPQLSKRSWFHGTNYLMQELANGPDEEDEPSGENGELADTEGPW